jgi:hypothetical protein
VALFGALVLRLTYNRGSYHIAFNAFSITLCCYLEAGVFALPIAISKAANDASALFFNQSVPSTVDCWSSGERPAPLMAMMILLTASSFFFFVARAPTGFLRGFGEQLAL